MSTYDPVLARYSPSHLLLTEACSSACGAGLERMLEHAPARLGSALEGLGIEGDVRAATGWRSRHALRRVRSDVVLVSVPPFSLLAAAALALDRNVPLVLDYRDPWSARHHPPPIARATRAIERRAARRAAAVVFAGGAVLGDLLIRHLGLPPHRVVSVPNGIDPGDLVGLHPIQPRLNRGGQPLQLVMNGYWYGRNGPGILLDAPLDAPQRDQRELARCALHAAVAVMRSRRSATPGLVCSGASAVFRTWSRS
ncbi:MAG: glycosyltransferase [Pseudonocardiales bacterium]